MTGDTVPVGGLPAMPGPFEQEVIDRLRHDRVGTVPARSSDAPTAPKRATRRSGLRGTAPRAAVPMRAAPLTVVTSLLFARALDRDPDLVASLRTGSPVVVVDAPDPLVLSQLRGSWATLLYGEAVRIESVTGSLAPNDAAAADVLLLAVNDLPKPKDRDEAGRALLRILQVARPVLCLSPDAATAFAPEVLRAADHRVALPSLDAPLVATTIRIVTGRRVGKRHLARLAGLDVGPADLAIALRSDRSPADCVARLRRLGAKRTERTGRGRDLSLDQLHGMRPAVEWGRSTLVDVAAWRAGAPWSEVEAGLLLTGPPGTGKTLFAATFAAEGGMPLVVASLGQWQSADSGHLGTTLRAMRRSFDDAKALALGGPGGRRGAVLLVDEIDAFPDRASVRHDHRDYVVQVVNALLELLDGAGGREGVVVVGTTNDASRCDPAMLRPGRLGRLVELGYPDLDERVAMLRVRLGADLPDADLTAVGRLTERATGAAIEELVSRARRIARRADRALRLDDLLAVAGAADADRPPELLHRTAIHEAGHALVAALEIGTDRMVVALQTRDGAAGWLDMTRPDTSAGTRREIEATIRVALAGRAAEEVVLGRVTAGARLDLAWATSLAANLVGSWGLASRLLSFDQQTSAEILADPDLRAEAAGLLDQLYEDVRRVVRERQDTVLRLADRLVVERRLDGEAVARIVDVAALSRARDGDPSVSPAPSVVALSRASRRAP